MEVSSGAMYCTRVFVPARSHLLGFGAVVAFEEQPSASFVSISAQLWSGFAPAQKLRARLLVSEKIDNLHPSFNTVLFWLGSHVAASDLPLLLEVLGKIERELTRHRLAPHSRATARRRISPATRRTERSRCGHESGVRRKEAELLARCSFRSVAARSVFPPRSRERRSTRSRSP